MTARIHKLDGLRGILSLMVALYHFPKEYIPASLADFFVLRQANVFVDVFFVLSGFVIGYRYVDIGSAQKFKAFMRNRLYRLYPLLLFSVTAVLCLSLIQFGLHRTLMPKADDLSLLGLLSKYFDSILMLNSTPLLGSSLGLNFPSWSISSEMFSYLLFGLILLYNPKNQKVLFAIIVFSCAGFLFYSNQYYVSGRYGFVRGALNFGIGNFVYHIWNSTSLRSSNSLGWLSIFLLVCNLYFLNEIAGNQKDSLALFTVPLVSGFLVYAVAVSNGFVSQILSSKPFLLLGKLSYSIYLNHIFVASIFLKSYVVLFREIDTLIDQVLVSLLFVVSVIGYSMLTQKYVEVGGKRLLQKLFKTE